MIKYIKNDLFKSDATLLAHGCNCKGGFGSGVAAGMAKNYPESKNQYLSKHNTEGWKLGDVQFVLSDNKIIANCATQNNFLPRGKRHVDYNAVKVCMTKVKDFARLHGLTIGIPKIGAGLAGGDWELIEDILEDVFEDYDVTVYVLG